jgi:hypothetical protein
MKSCSKGSDKERLHFEGMSLNELNNEIERCLWGARNGGTTAGRKSYFKRLVWLEEIREEKHGVEAKRRDFRKM